MLARFWEGLLAPPPVGRVRPVQDLDISHLYGPKDVRRVDRFVQLAAVAAEEAVSDAGGVEALRGDPDKAGTYIGTGVGGLDTICQQHEVLMDKGENRVSPFLVPMIMANHASADLSMRYGLRGPCETTVTACAAGTQSIANAGRLIATGRCDVMVAGGSEAPLSPLGVAGFANMTALSRSGVSMPFDVDRDGFVIGEGAGVVVLEERERAIARGARIYTELAGAASTADAHHITAPSPDGAGAARCMELAMADARVSPGEITHINAHGTSTPLNDASEGQAILKVFRLTRPSGELDQRSDRAYARRRWRYRGSGRGLVFPPPPESRPPRGPARWTRRCPSTSSWARQGTGSPARRFPTRSASAATTGAWCWCRPEPSRQPAPVPPLGEEKLGLSPARALRRFCAVAAGDTLYQTSSRVPSGPTRNAERSIPM